MKTKIKQNLIIVSDMDGVITPAFKVWYEKPPGNYAFSSKFSISPLTVAKLFSDRDSSIISLMKDFLIFLSIDDRINKEYSEHKNIPFIHAANGKYRNKFDYLNEYWTNILKREGSPKGKYIYIGDSLPDLRCLINASIAYIPQDASKLLIKTLCQTKTSFIKLTSKGGEGCLEEIFLDLLNKKIIELEY
jgi:3-deoxy-D-manno-octulosonate 8-phosphate phosphatase KdsC-like HAD superfamily phosphatase